MISPLHATLTEMFRHRPALAAELLIDILGVSLPPHVRARWGPGEVPELRPAEHRADGVVLLDAEQTGDPPAGAVVVEVQLRIKEEKLWTWPEYVAAVRRRWRCPTVLLVMCADESTARWARTPIDLDGLGSRLRPVVLGPELVPLIVDPALAARTPELTVIAALAHTRNEGPFTAIDVMVDALAHVEVDQAIDYTRLVLARVPERARAHLEDLMSSQTYTYESEWTRRLRGEGRAEGLAEGRAAMVLRVLTRRGIAMDESARVRIQDCTDLEQLETWFDRALDADAVEDLFA